MVTALCLSLFPFLVLLLTLSLNIARFKPYNPLSNQLASGVRFKIFSTFNGRENLYLIDVSSKLIL